MVIDVHTHVYPDKIAARTVALLQSAENHPVYSDGTLKGLKEAMDIRAWTFRWYCR